MNFLVDNQLPEALGRCLNAHGHSSAHVLGRRMDEASDLITSFMSVPGVIKVFICNLVGEYLCRDGQNWSFSTDQTKAHIFDYEADKVPDKVVMAWRDFGAFWVAVQVSQKDEGETCDGCARKLRYTDILFDGTCYLCSNCRDAKERPVPTFKSQ